MGDFNDFILYVNDNVSELTYDTLATIKNEYKPTLTLSQDDITLVTKIVHNHTMSLFRQYHAWLKKSQQ